MRNKVWVCLHQEIVMGLFGVFCNWNQAVKSQLHNHTGPPYCTPAKDLRSRRFIIHPRGLEPGPPPLCSTVSMRQGFRTPTCCDIFYYIKGAKLPCGTGLDWTRANGIESCLSHQGKKRYSSLARD
jgi:hypothetical protein